MFIELSEFLRCPEPHQETFCVVAPEEMAGRMILRGLVGCPICKREYPIERGIVRFGGAAAEAVEGAGAADPDAVWALLGLTGPGGFVVLVGSAVRLAEPLAVLLGGVHLVGVNAPADVAPTAGLSLLAHPSRIPLRHEMARGVVLGTGAAVEPWIGEGVRVLLPGLRLVATAESLSAPNLDQVAVGRGLWVGQKVGKGEPGKGKRDRAMDNG